MECRLVLSRSSLILRALSQRSATVTLQPRRAASYESSINPQPPLSKALEDCGVHDVNAGPPGPVDPKIRQLQKFYQTPTGRPIWRKTAVDDFFFKLTVVWAAFCLCYCMYVTWYFINPKPKKA